MKNYKKLLVAIILTMLSGNIFAQYSISNSIVDSYGASSSNANYSNLSAGGQRSSGNPKKKIEELENRLKALEEK